MPVKVTVKNENWVETISICSTTSNAIALNDIEFKFNYAVKMSTNLWGQPWAAWHVQSQNGQQVVLLGGTSNTPALQPDPNYNSPLTIQLNASSDTPAPIGPFVFKAAGISSNEKGTLNIAMSSIPEAELANPQVTITGMGQTLNHTVAWGTQWQLTNIAVGDYTVTSSTVSNGMHTYQAKPVTTNLKTQIAPTYTPVNTAAPFLGIISNILSILFLKIPNQAMCSVNHFLNH